MGVKLYRLIFLAELLAAILPFAHTLPLRKGVWRVPCGVALFSIATVLLSPIGGEVSDSFWRNCLFYALMYLLLSAFVFGCFQLDWLNALLISCAVYVAQHFAYDVRSLLTYLLPVLEPETFTFSFFAGEFLTFLIVYALLALTLGRKLTLIRERNSRRFRWMLLTLMILCFVIAMNLLISDVTDAFAQRLTRCYDLLGCVFIFLMLFYLSDNNHLRGDVERLEQMLAQKQEVYELSRENIALINIRCHDMKQQLEQLRTRQQLQLSTEFARELEKNISVYDALVKTGNEALDVVLSEKTLYCEQHRIRLTYMADGAQLCFMNPVDLYVLFGNILQNAIESVEQFPAEEQRIISLTVKKKGALLSIQEENYYQQELRFEDGLPQTTKTDTKNHGFGMKSIYLLVKKYGGDLTVQGDGGIFSLNILIPLSE